MTLEGLREQYAALVDRARRMDEIGRPDLAGEIHRAAERVFEVETRMFNRGLCDRDSPISQPE